MNNPAFTLGFVNNMSADVIGRDVNYNVHQIEINDSALEDSTKWSNKVPRFK